MAATGVERAPRASGPTRICIVGPGTRFLSGISYYTLALANALAEVSDSSALLLRRLLPARLYPGRARVGAELCALELDRRVARFDGLDWFWLPSLYGAVRFLVRERPHYLLLEWWTGAVLHSYLALGLVARLLGIRLLIEFHETQDASEVRIGWARRYVSLFAPRLFARAEHYVAHSEQERAQISERYGIDSARISVIPHAAYGHYAAGAGRSPHDDCNLLFFGVIRPFKGLEDLVRAFELLAAEQSERYRLTVVGETWEGWTLPGELIEASPYRERISFVNRYVTDAEVDAAFADADLVVLPYHRSAQSGPLHVAISYGLPVVISAVGGAIEAVADYEGAVLCEPRDPEGLATAIRQAEGLVGGSFESPHDWQASAEAYRQLLVRLQDRVDGAPLTLQSGG